MPSKRSSCKGVKPDAAHQLGMQVTFTEITTRESSLFNPDDPVDRPRAPRKIAGRSVRTVSIVLGRRDRAGRLEVLLVLRVLHYSIGDVV
jgi:hypothetical protein